MAQRVVFHIGLMKSGTTFIQGRLNANRERLAEQKVLFPGPTWNRHVRAVSDLLGSDRRKPGSWNSLVDEVNGYDGTAVVSMEYLAPMGRPRIKVLRDSFPGTEIRVAVTVRDLGRSVPAMWQEAIKNRRTWTWDEYVRAIQKGGEPGRRFWRQQHAGKIVQRWGSVIGRDHVYVVTVPPPGAAPGLLWDRFSEVAEIRPAEWDDGPRANESLGAASTLVMRQLNFATQDLPLPAYKKRVKALAKYVMGGHRGAEDPIGFTVPTWLREESARVVTQVERSGARIVGDLADLEPVDVRGVDPAAVGDAAQLDAAVAALAGVLQQVRQVRRTTADPT
jgi:hypothetical protein